MARGKIWTADDDAAIRAAAEDRRRCERNENAWLRRQWKKPEHERVFTKHEEQGDRAWWDEYIAESDRRRADVKRARLRDVADQLGRTYGAVRKRAHQIRAKSYR